MARKFNLQPWREQRRDEQKKNFTYASFGIVFLCAAALGADYWQQTNYIEEQKSAISQLEENINKLSTAETEVKRLQELNRQVNLQIDVIQGLQAERGLATEMLDYIAQHTPETVFLSSINYQAGKVVITGVASNDSGVAQFIRNMEKFQYFSKASIENIVTAVKNNSFTVPEGSEVKQFTVHIDVKRNPKVEGGQG
ncbi:PilN domain-containing protein [uncultured Cardiobacterium sp.]|jgi:type IV pilus biogenesis protein pilN|uniref:PilN domain-containing protein n=1 Tax=uncultured Cardiobacterium sp. TaxID=417619 RepID=UPI000F1788F1|nr:PilN domain-containing protein [uncultured Cardiobacterium sp.]RKV65291.1 MAG: pilus assembly protein PilN [Neisseria sp.]